MRSARRISPRGSRSPGFRTRTGGEQRISNFLLWNLAYAELLFTEVLFPDFSAADLDAALEFFARRERRFGKTSAQVTTKADA
jgi:undecaprenyl diphosphate synthase